MIPMSKSGPASPTSNASMTGSTTSLAEASTLYCAERRLSAMSASQEEFLRPTKKSASHRALRFKFYSSPYLFRPLPPINMNSLVNAYLPAVGAISYEALSVHLVHKGIFSRLRRKLHFTDFRFFGDRDLSVVNSLLYTSHIGIGLYIYNSPPVCFAASYNRLMYSVFGSVLFNFGSLLLWSTLRSALHSFHPAAKIFMALSCASTMLFVGADYVHFLRAWLRGQP